MTSIINKQTSSNIMPLSLSKLAVSLLLIPIILTLSSRLVTSSDEYLISQFSEQQDEDLLRIERLEMKVSHMMRDMEKFRKWNKNCQYNEQITTFNKDQNALPGIESHHQSGPKRATKVPIAPFAPGRSSIKRRSVDVSLPSAADRQANFLRGEPGRNGLDGVPGLDGAPGLDGVPGIDGRNGRDGANGRDGVDGKDGMPGEKGPIGPPGPPGEPGKRGKPGPPGKTGSPGPPGVCAYKAQYDCSKKENGSEGANESIAGLLVAPTMIGESIGVGNKDESSTAIEHQVTVNEGDNIQLSCEASGLPKPNYIWHRTIDNKKSTILMDVTTDLQVTSYSGGQLPLFSVDRLQAGNYECLASNGVPPDAAKRINLDVNYAPTVRLHPGPSVHKVKMGSSLLVECLVDANPSPFTYWMFANELLMTIATPSQVMSSTAAGEYESSQSLDVAPRKKLKKYTITESTGQLATGAYYTILTLYLANINSGDLGLYKCVSKNLIGQTVGYLWLESSDGSGKPTFGDTTSDSRFRETILERGSNYVRFDHTLGWPSYLIERANSANYSIFDNSQRRQLDPNAKKSLLTLLNDTLNRKLLLESLILGQKGTTNPIERLNGANGNESNTLAIKNTITGQIKSSDGSVKISHKNSSSDHQTLNEVHTGRDQGSVEMSTETSVVVEENGAVQVVEGVSEDEIELCRVESNLATGMGQQSATDGPDSPRSSSLLLDQVGKPVYVGSITGGLLNWWSMDTKFKNVAGEISDISFSTHYYATSPNKSDILFEYNSLVELLKDQKLAVDKLSLGSESKTQYHLQHHILGNSNLIYGRKFIYVTLDPKSTSSKSVGKLRELVVVISDLNNDKNAYLQLDDKIWRDLGDQPRDLGQEYKLNRVELASDENGVWLIVPTFEDLQDEQPGVRNHGAKRKSSSLSNMQLVRRIHIFKLNWTSSLVLADQSPSVYIDYHVSMKLDWRMIGQLFVIDGVLYGIKDRSLYSSKLQFAYDLYKCKLLSTEYLNEPHRTFTNHFGDTQMIKYNPNEPKRLYTIDNGNLLWCPVKLIQI